MFVDCVAISEYGDGVVDVTTGELVPINDAPLPAVYERATKALAECSRIVDLLPALKDGDS